MKTVIAWWILVQCFGCGDTGSVPRAIGPYPSQEMCRLAGNRLMPTDRQFWTEAARAKAEEEDKARSERARLQQEALDKEAVVFIARAKRGEKLPSPVTLSGGERVFIEPGLIEGDYHAVAVRNLTGTASYGGFLSIGPQYDALTPCVEIKSKQREVSQ